MEQPSIAKYFALNRGSRGRIRTCRPWWGNLVRLEGWKKKVEAGKLRDGAAHTPRSNVQKNGYKVMPLQEDEGETKERIQWIAAAASQFAFQLLQLGKESVMEGLPELFWRQGLAARPTQFSLQFYYLSSPLTLRPWQARFHPSIPLTSTSR